MIWLNLAIRRPNENSERVLPSLEVHLSNSCRAWPLPRSSVARCPLSAVFHFQIHLECPERAAVSLLSEEGLTASCQLGSLDFFLHGFRDSLFYALPASALRIARCLQRSLLFRLCS